jgi:putative membrane protein
MIKLADSLLAGFEVDGWLWALIFSFLLSLLTSIGDSVVGGNKDKKDRD